MLKKNLVKILILTLKMCDFANKLAPTAASPQCCKLLAEYFGQSLIKCGLCAKNFSPSKMNFWDVFCLINLEKICSQNFFSPILSNAF